jgi:predicted dehydrogenase
LHGVVLNCAGDDQLVADHWFWDASVSGGIFVEHGVHFFDLMRSWLGSGRVTSATRYFRPGGTVVDQVHCTVRYGAQGSVDFYHGFHQASALDRQEIRLIFERGEIRLKGWIADSIEMLAALDDESIEKVSSLLEGPTIVTVSRYEGDARNISRRGKVDVVDRVVRISWAAERPSSMTYGMALRALMSDFLCAVKDPRRKLRVTSEDGKAALSLALDATRIASEESEY